MIDEQHPMQIGLFPMDIKCQQHLHQQQQQQQLQIQQQLQQQQQATNNNMLLNGNERMLTTTGTGTATGTAIVSDKMANMVVTTTATTATRNVNGSCCDSHNGSNNNNNNNNNHCNNNNNNCNSNGNSNSSNTNGNKLNCNNNSNSNNHINHHQQQQQTHACGPGPPNISHTTVPGPGPPLTMHASMNSAGRVTLGECSLNGIASGHIGALCVNNNNNNSNSNSNSNYAHHQQHLQLPLPLPPPPPPAPPTNTMLHTHSHPVAALHNGNGCSLTSVAGDMLSSSSSSSSSLSSTSSSLSSSSSSSSLCVPINSGRSNSGNGNAVVVASMASIAAQCGYCCQPICDRYIMRVVDTSFHEGCLKCATCSLHLVHSCYARDGKLFCRIDYERLYLRNRCLGCGHKIAADELVMRTLENVFHLKCFACVVCGALLKKGEQYVVKQGQLFCRFDYEKEVEMLQGYDFYGDDLFPPKMDGRRGPKRPRTILNTQQRRAFKASFEVSPKPCRKVRENLAKETGLSLRIVQVWFQNQRAKVKKIQKKAKQEPNATVQKGTSDSQDSQESQDSNLTKVKDEAHSDSESQLESPYSTSSDSLAKLRCIKDENENAPFNCMETNKENCNKTNEPILNTILGLSYATFQQLMGPFTQTPMINPIDRLYSMQNSYFRPDDLGYGECGKDMMEH